MIRARRRDTSPRRLIVPARNDVRAVRHRAAVATMDQALLLELDRHPSSTAEELSGYLRGEAHLSSVLRWLRSHEGWLVVRDAMRWRLSSQGETFLAALD